MKLTYRLQKTASGWYAECVESDAAGEGATEEEALQSLRTSIEERMFRPDAVAPPPEIERSVVELELAAEPATRDSLDLGGPGGE